MAALWTWNGPQARVRANGGQGGRARSDAGAYSRSAVTAISPHATPMITETMSNTVRTCRQLDGCQGTYGAIHGGRIGTSSAEDGDTLPSRALAALKGCATRVSTCPRRRKVRRFGDRGARDGAGGGNRQVGGNEKALKHFGRRPSWLDQPGASGPGACCGFRKRNPRHLCPRVPLTVQAPHMSSYVLMVSTGSPPFLCTHRIRLPAPSHKRSATAIPVSISIDRPAVHN